MSVRTRNDKDATQNLINSPFWSCDYMYFVVSRNKQLCKKLVGILVWHVSLHFPRNHYKFIALLFLNLAILKSVKDQNLWSQIKLIRRICEKIFGKTQPACLLWTIFIPITVFEMSRLSKRPGKGVRCSNSVIFLWRRGGSVFNVTSKLIVWRVALILI